MKRILMLGAIVALAGCSTMTTQQQSALNQEIAATTPHCVGAKRCEAAWDAARTWILNNCSTKLQTVTNSYMQTFNTGQYSASLECSVNRNPLPSGGYTIEASFGCNNFLGCVPDGSHATLSFNNYVDGVMQEFAKGR